MATQTLSFTPEGICDAARIGNLNHVRQIIGVDPRLVHAANPFHGRKPLHYAAREGHAPVVQALLEAGADLNETVYPNREITHPLTLARERGRTETVRVMEDWVAHQAPETSSTLGRDLCRAVRSRDAERVRALLNADPSAVHQTDPYGNTALHVAAQIGNWSLAIELLRQGADPDPQNKAGLRPIHFALNKDLFSTEPLDLTTAGVLLSQGAACDVWVASAMGDEAALQRLLKEDPGRANETQGSPGYPLTIAVRAGHLNAVQTLLAHGADPDAPKLLNPESPAPFRESGLPLLCAAQLGRYEIARALLGAGADPNTHVDACPSAASAAYQNGHDEIAELLFRRGAFPDSAACFNRKNLAAIAFALHLAPQQMSKDLLGCGDPDIIRLCLRHNPELSGQDRFDLMFNLMRVNSDDLARAKQNAQILELFLNHGFDPNIRSQENTTLLHRTMGCMWRGRWCNSEDVMIEFSRVLLDHGADLNARDDDLKSTPLAWHARYGHAKVVEYLLSRGAATNLPDNEPWATPLAWAEKKGHAEIANLLRRQGAKA